MHRFIVYQYGKVGSTSLVDALNKIPDCKAFQSHFLGEAAFEATLKRVMDPTVPDYFFEHSVGQLVKNLRIYRHYLQRGSNGDQLTVISLAREPFDWFRSSICQDIDQHLKSLRLMLGKKQIVDSDDNVALAMGMEFLFDRLLQAIRHYGSVDATCAAKRWELNSILDFADPEDFQTFMFFLNIFLRPHIWFQNHFREFLQADIRDMETLEPGLLRRVHDWGNIYLLRYEDLDSAYPQLVTDLGYPAPRPLPRKNDSQNKRFSKRLLELFNSDAASELKALCHSADTRLLGYH